MKKTLLFIAVIFLYGNLTQAQDNYSQQMRTAVAKLDQAVAVKDYQQLAAGFESIAQQGKTSWLPWYYAAFCNAKIGWLYQQDGDRLNLLQIKQENEIKNRDHCLIQVPKKNCQKFIVLSAW
jgi:hypothetical protein